MSAGEAMAERSHVGANIYFWGAPHQNRLLSACVGPVAAELRREGLCQRFWFNRFGARGPHVFALFTVPRAAHGDVAGRLAQRIEAYLASAPSTEVLSPEAAMALHLECRGKKLCQVDAEDGIAANNSYHLFEHGPRDYPFWLAEGVTEAEEEELWQLLDRLCSWAVEAVGARPDKPPTAQALRWFAALDRAIGLCGIQAEPYWRHHATTLILGLKERLAADEAAVLRSLPGASSEQNRQVFGRVFQEAEVDDAAPPPAPWPDLRRLVAIAAADDGRPIARRWGLLREIVHTTLIQMGIPVAQHVPMVLFAWQRHLG